MTLKTKAYIPTFLKSALSGSRPIQLTFSDVQDTNIKSTSSFIYDPVGSPLKSTQQLNVDWSKFENHTFFMSAEAKVNLAYEQIINGYPFDGTRKEVEKYFENLSGFDNWIYQQFPKFRGQLHFSGTQTGEDTNGTLGTWISVNDSAGGLYPEISKNASGESVLNPKNGSMTIELHLYVPEIATDGYQIIAQKQSSDTQGYTMYLVPTVSTTTVEARFNIVSGSLNINTHVDLDKGSFNHIAFIFDNENENAHIRSYHNSELKNISKAFNNFGILEIDSSKFLIGSGTAFKAFGSTITPTQTLSASMDELRVFHDVRTTSQLRQYAKKSIYAQPELKLYYKFNEPAPPLSSDGSIDSIVIDSSGNALHATIANFVDDLRQNAAEDETNLMIYELDESSPVLFPANTSVIELNQDLLASASLYDSNNPNLITKLIPQHYLLDAASYEGLEELNGESGKQYSGDGIKGSGKLGNVQLILSFLYIYAKFFDELKLFVDSFSTLKYVDYDKIDTIPDNHILTLIQQNGFYLPPLFNDSTLEQYIRAENIDYDISVSTYPLRHVQNELLRRTLINMPDILRSKGTQHSIKSFLRSVGIDPDNSMRIREFGGANVRSLDYSREIKREPGVMADFTTASLAYTPFLSASRIEPGYPTIAGTFVMQNLFPPNGISNNVNDGLLTSGSWTVEEIVKWSPAHIRAMTHATQSLIRMCVTGSSSAELGLVANLLAISSSIDSKLLLYVRPGSSTASPLLKLELPITSPGLFNGDRWNVSFGCERNDSFNSYVSSSYFLRAAMQENGKIEIFNVTSSYFYETTGGSDVNVFRTKSSSTSVSGAFIKLGENDLINNGAGAGYVFLNNTSVPDEARITNLTALVSNFRFWSKALTEIEWKEHVRNYKSRGVKNPLLNYNYVFSESGSFEKLRLETLMKQETRVAAGSNPTGNITFLDFSENNMNMLGSGFSTQTGSMALRSELFDYSYISPYFDEAVTDQKIRVRGYQSLDLVNEHPWSAIGPIHEIVKSEAPTDDVRFAIEFSLVDALNRDIMTIFATLESLDNALGSPELMFSPDYPDLERLRDVYFNRIHEKLNFKAFAEFFRWFDMSIGTFIEQLVPKKTSFKGTNFLIESHVLERHKMEYYSNESYLTISDRSKIKDVLLLQQIVGSLRKF